jgi:hypothetical protein
VGYCLGCGGGPGVPGALGLWRNVTVPFAGVARSAEFSVSTYFVVVDDMVLAHVPQEPTPIPTQGPRRAADKGSERGDEAPHRGSDACVPQGKEREHQEALHDEEAEGPVRKEGGAGRLVPSPSFGPPRSVRFLVSTSEAHESSARTAFT